MTDHRPGQGDVKRPTYDPQHPSGMGPFNELLELLRCLANSDKLQSWRLAPSPHRVSGMIATSALLGNVEEDKVSLFEPLETPICHKPLLASFATSFFTSKQQVLKIIDSGHGGRICGDSRQKTLTQANTRYTSGRRDRGI